MEEKHYCPICTAPVPTGRSKYCSDACLAADRRRRLSSRRAKEQKATERQLRSLIRKAKLPRECESKLLAVLPSPPKEDL
jgi:predicted nucleic acid-binding Zn ribbon protein